MSNNDGEIERKLNEVAADFPAYSDGWDDGQQSLLAERAALRAENHRQSEKLMVMRSEMAAMDAENERLRARRLAEHEQYDLWRQQRDDAQAEIERLNLTLEIAKEMRSWQKRYFKDRTPSALTQSKQLERELDRRLEGQTDQPDLFGTDKRAESEQVQPTLYGMPIVIDENMPSPGHIEFGNDKRA